MASRSFTLDWEQEGHSTGSADGAKSKENAGPSDSQDSLAWEINFEGGDEGRPKKSTSMPKFLRERQQERPTSKPISPRHPGRSSSSPVKARGAKSVSKSPLKSAALPSRSQSAASKEEPSKQGNTISPKKSPAIKKSLLPMRSPVRSPVRKTDKSLEMRSQSDCALAVGTSTGDKSPSRGGVARKQRPHSAAPSLGGSPPPSQVDTSSQRPTQAYSAGGRGRATSSHSNQSKDKEVPRQSKSLPAVTLRAASEEEDTSSETALASAPSDMAQRKVLDLQRWYCMCHPQYSMSCGISSVVSCWNYLFSTLGNGSLPPVTQEAALTLLGFEPPFGEIKFGPFTGNATCMRWFQQLCGHFGVSGQSYYFYKPVGRRRTFGIQPGLALERLQDGLRDPTMAFIYHCYNHYFCPIGFEDVPKKATDAYRVNLRADQVDTWVLIGEPSRRQSAIHCKRWSDIVKDLNCKSPEIFNIRHTERGVRTRNTKRKGGNLHCIMAFRKVQESFTTFSTINTTDGGIDYVDSRESVSLSEVEDLDSSDSDFSDLPEQPLTRSKNSPDLSIDFNKFDVPDIKTITSPSDEAETVVQTEQLDAVTSEPASSGLRRSGTFTKEGPTIRVEVRRLPSTDSESSNIDDSNATHSETDGTRPHLLVAASSTDGDEVKDYSSPIRRSGTFTKDTPTIRVQKTRVSSSDYDSDSDTNLEPAGHNIDTDESLERPTLTSRHSDSDSSSLQDSKDDSILSPGESMAPSGLRRSGTFTKEKPSIVFDGGSEEQHSKASSEEDSEDITRSEHLQTTSDADGILSKMTEDDMDLDETLKASDFLNESS